MRRRAARTLLGALILAMVAAGCSAGGIRAGGDDAPRVRIPGQILGLTVTPEDISGRVEDVDRSYLNSVGMFSFRDDDLLRATLQVGRFNSAGRLRDNPEQFRSAIISLLGTEAPQELRVGDTQVFSTSGNEQIVYVWFDGSAMFVLSVHREFEFPRTLLRRTLTVELV